MLLLGVKRQEIKHHSSILRGHTCILLPFPPFISALKAKVVRLQSIFAEPGDVSLLINCCLIAAVAASC